MEHKFSLRRALSILVVLTMVFSSVAAFAFTADAEGEDASVLLIDAVNAASWGEDAVPFAPILVYGSDKLVKDHIGGVWNGWWYKIIATYDEASDLFIVDEKLANDGSTEYADMTLGEGQIMILVYCGAEAVVLEGCTVATNIQAGDALKATGFDFSNESASDLITKDGDAFASPVYFTLSAKAPETPEAKSENVAAGKSYTHSDLFMQDKVSISYPDEDGKTMTDGKFPADDAVFSAPEFAGWNAQLASYSDYGYNWITVDLGESYDLSKYVIWYGTIALGAGIKSPTSVEVYVSEDGENWGEKVGAAVPEDSAEVINECVTIEANATGRYVQFRFASTGWAFISEVEVYNAGSTDDALVTVKEEITVDGDLSDNGWTAEGWTAINSENGYWQSVPETDDTISYKYQLRTDETKLYAAFVIDCAAVEGGNGNGTNVRFWINTNDEATVYTHFYDVFVGGTGAKYNQATDANKGAAIENSTINAVLKSEGEKTYVEFSIDLAEFNGAEGFNYYICVSNKINENVCLYTPVVPVGEEDSRLANLPYNTWYTEGQGVADVEALKLGEIVVPGGDDDDDQEPAGPTVEELMQEALGVAPQDAKVDYVIEAPETYEAGDEITVKVHVKNITAENGIHVVSFILNYDNTKLVLISDLDEEDDNVLQCVVDLPKDWENLSSVANDYNDENPEGTEVKPLNDGIIEVNVFTAKSTASAAIKEDDALVLEFKFKAVDDAEGDIGLVIPHETAEGAYNGKEGEIVYEANGDYAVIKAPVVEDPSEPSEPDEPVVPGDASNMIIFAIIALVAIAGSAVVIKTRK